MKFKLLLLFLIFALIRGISFFNIEDVYSDAVAYKYASLAIIEDNFFWNPRYNHFPPLYPLFTSFFYMVIGDILLSQKMVSLFMSFLIIVPAYLIFRHLGVCASSSIHPCLIIFASPIVTALAAVNLSDITFATLLLFAIYFAMKENGIVSGLFLGLCFLTRYAGVIYLPAFLIFFWIRRQRQLAFFVVGFLLVSWMWLYRNYALFGNPLHTKYLVEAKEITLYDVVSNIPSNLSYLILSITPFSLYVFLTKRPRINITDERFILVLVFISGFLFTNFWTFSQLRYVMPFSLPLLFLLDMNEKETMLFLWISSLIALYYANFYWYYWYYWIEGEAIVFIGDINSGTEIEKLAHPPFIFPFIGINTVFASLMFKTRYLKFR